MLCFCLANFISYLHNFDRKCRSRTQGFCDFTVEIPCMGTKSWLRFQSGLYALTGSRLTRFYCRPISPWKDIGKCVNVTYRWLGSIWSQRLRRSVCGKILKQTNINLFICIEAMQLKKHLFMHAANYYRKNYCKKWIYFLNKIFKKFYGLTLKDGWRRKHNRVIKELFGEPDIVGEIRYKRLRWQATEKLRSNTTALVYEGLPEGRRPIWSWRTMWKEVHKDMQRMVVDKDDAGAREGWWG